MDSCKGKLETSEVESAMGGNRIRSVESATCRPPVSFLARLEFAVGFVAELRRVELHWCLLLGLLRAHLIFFQLEFQSKSKFELIFLK